MKKLLTILLLFMIHFDGFCGSTQHQKQVYAQKMQTMLKSYDQLLSDSNIDATFLLKLLKHHFLLGKKVPANINTLKTPFQSIDVKKSVLKSHFSLIEIQSSLEDLQKESSDMALLKDAIKKDDKKLFTDYKGLQKKYLAFIVAYKNAIDALLVLKF